MVPKNVKFAKGFLDAKVIFANVAEINYVREAEQVVVVVNELQIPNTLEKE